MFTIKLTYNSEMMYSFIEYLKTESWGGARDRVQEWKYEDFELLAEYLEECKAELTETQLNDFIWFEWDDIKKELK